MSSSWGQNYSPDQMLRYASIDTFDMYSKLENLVRDLMALMITEKDPEQLVDKMKELLRNYGRVSIGHALDTLFSVAKTGPELDYGRDGLDCLTYHLSSHGCENGIWALKAVLARFKEDEKKPTETPRYKSGNPRPSLKELQEKIEFKEGYQAFKIGVARNLTPYTSEINSDAWNLGWQTAENDWKLTMENDSQLA